MAGRPSPRPRADDAATGNGHTGGPSAVDVEPTADSSADTVPDVDTGTAADTDPGAGTAAQAEPGSEAEPDAATDGAGPDAATEQSESAPTPTPRPVGRVGRDETTVSYPPQSEVSAPSAPRTGAAARRSAHPMLLPAVLTVVAVLLGAFAVVAAIQSSSLGADDTDNTALTDEQTTTQVRQQSTNALNTLFSFDYKDPGKTANNAKNLITGKVDGKYRELITKLEQEGPKNKLTLNSSVLTSGVERLQGNRARVLALMAQIYSTGEGGSADKTPVPVAVRADMHKVGGSWKVDGLALLTS